MSDWLRRAGRGRLAGGEVVRWSVAEGERGRRWRWTIDDGSGLRRAALAEIDPRGRFARLELSTAGGMLTVHPETDRRSINGNVVHAGGVRPIELPWNDGIAIGLEVDPFGTAVLGGGGEPGSIVISAGLAVGPGGAEVTPALEVDRRGVPALLDPAEWPLED